MSEVKAFNNYLKQFINCMCQILPSNEKINMASKAFHLPLILDQKIYIKHFNDGTRSPYDNYILSKNENIFTDYDFSLLPDVNGMDSYTQEIKEVWTTLSQEHKDIVWQYLKILVTLAKRYYK